MEARRVKDEVLLGKDEIMKKNLDMLLWIVTNWTFHNNSLPPEVAQIIP